MADILKVLGQATPSAATVTDLYTVPSNKATVISYVAICNRSATVATKVRLSIAPAGAADATSQYIVYDYLLQPNETLFTAQGSTLATTDKMRGYNETANVTWTVCGTEVPA